MACFSIAWLVIHLMIVMASRGGPMFLTGMGRNESLSAIFFIITSFLLEWNGEIIVRWVFPNFGEGRKSNIAKRFAVTGLPTPSVDGPAVHDEHVARVTSHGMFLSVFVTPAGPVGFCIRAAHVHGSEYANGCPLVDQGNVSVVELRCGGCCSDVTQCMQLHGRKVFHFFLYQSQHLHSPLLQLWKLLSRIVLGSKWYETVCSLPVRRIFPPLSGYIEDVYPGDFFLLGFPLHASEKGSWDCPPEKLVSFHALRFAEVVSPSLM